MNVDFKRWALVSTNDSTGVGRMAQDMKAVLPLGRHLVIPSAKSANRPLDSKSEFAISPDCSDDVLEAALSGLQGVILLERHDWHPNLLKSARRLGIKTLCVPMWEWFRGLDPAWKNCDFFACPNHFSVRVLARYGFTNAMYVPWTLDLARFPGRKVTGPAKRFVHNAGLIDPDDRKGTHATEQAFRATKKTDLRLTIRSQNASQLTQRDSRIDIWTGSFANPAELYASGDCFIQPSKLEGLGFMVVEAVASGLPVITTDYPPMNEYVSQKDLRASLRPFAYPAYSSAWIEHSHLRLPSIADLTRRIEWAAEHHLAAISAHNRAWAETTFAPATLLNSWEATLAAVLSRPSQPFTVGGAAPKPPCLSFTSKLRRRVSQASGLNLPFLSPPL